MSTKKRKELEEAIQDALTKGRPKLDAAAIMAMVDEVAEERVQAEREAGIQRRPARKIRHFGFDVPKLQAMARAKMEAEKLDWPEAWARTGVTVPPLRQHLGPNPPTSMGLTVAVAFMAWVGEFDLLAFLTEE